MTLALWLPGKKPHKKNIKKRRTLLTHQSRQEGEDAGMAVGSNSNVWCHKLAGI